MGGAPSAEFVIGAPPTYKEKNAKEDAAVTAVETGEDSKDVIKWLVESGIDEPKAKTYAVDLEKLGVDCTDHLSELKMNDLKDVFMDENHRGMVLAKLTEVGPIYASTKPLEATNCMQRGTRKNRARDASKFSTSKSLTNFSEGDIVLITKGNYADTYGLVEGVGPEKIYLELNDGNKVTVKKNQCIQHK